MLNTFVEGNFFALSKGALFAKKVVGVTRVRLEVRGFVMALRPCHHVGISLGNTFQRLDWYIFIDTDQ